MAKIFKHFPAEAKCPICGDSEDGKCFLLGIDGTREDNIEQAKPAHVDCILNNLDGFRFRAGNEFNLIYMMVDKQL